MPISVLIADDSDVMRAAITKALKEEPSISIAGEVSTFAEAMRLIREAKPDVLLLDLNLAEKFPPDLVKSQLLDTCVIAISFANDRNSKNLARSYGVAALLDKVSLHNEMLPAIWRCRPEWKPPRGATNTKAKPPNLSRSLHALHRHIKDRSLLSGIVKSVQLGLLQWNCKKRKHA